MTVHLEVDVYSVRVSFDRLFADPAVFDDPARLAQKYLVSAGVPTERAAYFQQTTKEIVPVDDSGKPSVVAGTAKYRHQGRRVRSEYMTGANLKIAYVDFGSGLSPENHETLWKKGRWGEMKFEVKSFHHEKVMIELPDINELFQMLLVRADPTTFASLELANVPESLFQATFGYVEDRLRRLAASEGGTVEVYAARDLSPEERRVLEKRLARESTRSTVHVMLSKTRLQPSEG